MQAQGGPGQHTRHFTANELPDMGFRAMQPARNLWNRQQHKLKFWFSILRASSERVKQACMDA